MDHVAILRKANIKKGDNLLLDILNGEKTIESRWYVNRISPWNRIKKGNTVYFKESGSPVRAKARVLKVIQYNNLNLKKIKEIINKFGRQIAPHTNTAESFRAMLGRTNQGVFHYMSSKHLSRYLLISHKVSAKKMSS